MLLEFLDKKTVELRKFVEQKNIDKLGLNILFACGIIFVAGIEIVFAENNISDLDFWVVGSVLLLVVATSYFVKKVEMILSIYSIAVYCFIDCQINMILLAHFYCFDHLPLSKLLKWKVIFVIALIYFVLRELQNRNILKFRGSILSKWDNEKIFRWFQGLLIIGAAVFGEIVFVVDTITLGKLPQIVLCIIALTGLAIVICAGYGLDRRYDTKIFLGVSPLVYCYEALSYILVPDSFNYQYTISYIWIDAMGYIIA